MDGALLSVGDIAHLVEHNRNSRAPSTTAPNKPGSTGTVTRAGGGRFDTGGSACAGRHLTPGATRPRRIMSVTCPLLPRRL